MAKGQMLAELIKARKLSLKQRNGHSPAGFAHLTKEKKRTRPVYYSRGSSIETKLRKQNIDESDIKKMVGAKNYVGP